MKKRNVILPMLAIMAASCVMADNKYSEKDITGNIRQIIQAGGKTLGYSIKSGIQILTVDGFAFKDLNHNGKLDKYEDWRLDYHERAEDLARQLSIEEIAGLMLYSSHQAIPALEGGPFAGTYKGKTFSQSGADAAELTDEQRRFLTEDHVRHVLVTKVESPAVAARWNNNIQELAEGISHGIPVNNSSDPRHGTSSNAEYNYGAGGLISQWPGQLGLAATFDPELVRRFGDIASHEYRALGITTALSPQIDLGTEPRWSRISGTFGEDPLLSTDMARAYCDGFQSSEDNEGGWGCYSVNAMVKHWPGGGTGEGGRDAHFGYGKYAVYPGNNFGMHLKPFLEGAFRLEGGTEKASAIMPYYTISYSKEGKNGTNTGNSYNKYLITDLLRNTYSYDGVVCTDWGITADCGSVAKFEGKCWGVEKLSVARRHYEALKAGVDQFGGNNEKAPVLAAYRMGVKEFGETAMRGRFERSAVRLLVNIFRTGLFENPYVNPEESARVVGCPEYMKAGYEAQLKSIVMLKNSKDALPITNPVKVYIPKRFVKGVPDWWGNTPEDHWEYPVSIDLVSKYYKVVSTPEEADFALVFITSANGGTGYSTEDRKSGGNGYMPISLQYGSYTATNARAESLAGGAPDEDFTNRSYRGKTVEAYNTTDMDLVLGTKRRMGNKPVIVSLKMDRPCVLSEFEKAADAIIVDFETQAQAVLDIVSGKAEPSGLLPFQLPADMNTVECQKEDVPRDMIPYTDSEGHSYDFAFGMNWKGVIKDARTKKYFN